MNSKVKFFAIFFGLLVLSFFLFRSCEQQISNGMPGSMHNTGKAGAAALQRWLSKIGYQTQSFEFRDFAELDSEIDTLFVLSPSPENIWRKEEIDAVMRWVEDDAGTLIIVDNIQNSLYTQLDLKIEMLNEGVTTTSITPSHALVNPGVDRLTAYVTNSYFSRTRPNSQVIVGSESQPTLLGISRGRGMIYASTNIELYTNSGLYRESNAQIILNMVNREPAESMIAFDEVHHGRALPPKAAPVPSEPYSPLVAAMIYSAVVVGVWALFSGRRFGQMIPSKLDLMQRNSSEYVQSMANLYQRGRQAEHMQTHYKTYLKRRIAKPYGINPKIDDQSFLNEVQRYSSSIDQQRLGNLLNYLSQPNPSETTILALVNEVDRFIKDWEQQGRI